MMLASIEAVADGRFKLTGALTLLGLKELDQLFITQVVAKEDVTLDLAKTTRIDSAGLVLLLHWMRLFKAQGYVIRFLNPTTQMLSIAELSDISDILFIEAE